MQLTDRDVRCQTTRSTYVPVLDEPVLLASVFTVADRQNTVVKSLAAARRIGEHTIFVEPAMGMSGHLLIIVADF